MHHWRLLQGLKVDKRDDVKGRKHVSYVDCRLPQTAKIWSTSGLCWSIHFVDPDWPISDCLVHQFLQGRPEQPQLRHQKKATCSRTAPSRPSTVTLRPARSWTQAAAFLSRAQLLSLYLPVLCGTCSPRPAACLSSSPLRNCSWTVFLSCGCGAAQMRRLRPPTPPMPSSRRKSCHSRFPRNLRLRRLSRWRTRLGPSTSRRSRFGHYVRASSRFFSSVFFSLAE